MKDDRDLRSCAMSVNERFNKSSIQFLIKYGSYTYHCENDDSDYDIRGICIQSIDSYLSFIPPKDLVESKVSNDVDVVLFDIDKAFQLLSKYNPMIYEWLFSDQTLIDNFPFFNYFKSQLLKYYDSQVLYFHYDRMANADIKLLTENKRNYIKGSINVMRELICANLCAQDVIPPVSIPNLLLASNLDSKYLKLLSHLVESKRDNTGMCDYTNDQILSITSELLAINNSLFNKRDKKSNIEWVEYLNEYLIKLKRI